MALEKVLLPLVVDGGINTKIDSRMVPLGNNLELVNVDLNKVGLIKKKAGSSKISSLCDDGADLSTKGIRQIFSYKNEILATGRPGTDDFYSYSFNNSKWVKKSSFEVLPIGVEREKVYGERISSISPTMADATTLKFRVVGYVTDDGNIGLNKYEAKVYIEDYETKQTKLIWSNSGQFTVSDYIKELRINIVDQVNPVIYVTYLNWDTATGGYEIRVATIDRDGTSINDVRISPAGVIGTDLHFDTLISNGKLFVASHGVTATKIFCALIAQDGTISVSNNYTSTLRVIPSSISCIELNGKIYISYSRDNGGGSYSVGLFGLLSTDLTLSWVEQSYMAGAFTFYRSSIEAIDNNNLMLIADVLIEKEPGSPPISRGEGDQLWIAKINLTTFAGTVISSAEKTAISSQLFKVSGYSNIFFIAQTSAQNDQKYLTYSINTTDLSLERVSSFSQKIASNDELNFTDVYSNRNFNLYRPVVGRDGFIHFISRFYDRIIRSDLSVTSGFIYVSNIQILKLDFSFNMFSATLGENIIFSGSVIKEYDGRLFTVNNYIQSPPYFYFYNSAAGASTAGTHLYTYIYEYVDSNSQIVRSSPAPVQSYTSAGVYSVNIGFKNYSLPNSISQLPIDERKLSVIFYKTVNNGTVFYRCGSTRNVSLYGSDSPFVDSLSDADLLLNDSLYTNGGVLPNEQIPPVSHMVTANGRIFALSSEDKNVVFYSQPYLFGECVNFNENLSFRIDGGLLSRSGFGVGLANLDGRVVILKDRSILTIQGDGPNFAGENNTFTDPELVSSSIGCVDARSIVNIPQGVMFKSTKGIYILQRNLQLEYIGAPVEDYNSETIVKAIDDSDENRVIFQTTNRQLIFDYTQNKWWTSDLVASDIIDHNGTIYYLKDSVVYKRDKTLYKNNNVHYSMKLVSPWVKLSGLQNEQRLYEVVILGKYYSDHDLTVKIYYDYENTDVDTYTIYPLITDDNYQYRIKPTRQKCQSFKIEVSDVPRGTGQSCELSNITLRLGQKQGPHDLADGRKY